MSEKYVVRDKKCRVVYGPEDEVYAKNYFYAHKDQGFYIEKLPSVEVSSSPEQVPRRVDIFDAIAASARGS